jgi:copper ion binding protein
MSRISLIISGMTCGHCRQKVEDALAAVDGVWSASVDLDSGEAEVDFDDKLADAESLRVAVEEAGYQAAVAP